MKYPITLAVLVLAAGCSSTGEAVDDTSWARTFDVEKSDLGPDGGNAYFDLTPGTVSVLRDGDTVLSIAVLSETRVVDGVTTRIVEEREEIDGKPEEISRNYFACDRRTGDVYYFGEHVDVYENGVVSSHPGEWLSGEGGARFGLAFPAHPQVGQRFYQEIAPGLAMDRFEILSLSATVATPSGKYENCVQARETNPLEPRAVDGKWFAAGVGLVRDEDCLLVSHTRP